MAAKVEAEKLPTTKAEAKKALAALEAELVKATAERDKEMDRDWVEFAEDILTKMFKEFNKLGEYLDRCAQQVQDRGWVIAPHGRRRIMYRVLTGSRKIIADAGRRGKNSPIQNLSSEAGVTSGYLVLKAAHDYMIRFGIDMEHFPHYQRAVHDANYYAEAYCMMVPMLHIKQYVATYGVTEYFKEAFGFEMILDPEIALEIGINDKDSHEWDWSLPHIVKILHDVVDDAIKANMVEPEERQEILDTMFEPWVNKKTRRYLLTTYPLLNVPDLEEELLDALRAAGIEPRT